MYDLGSTGTIDRSEIRDMLLAVAKDTPELRLPDAIIERIVDQACARAGATHTTRPRPSVVEERERAWGEKRPPAAAAAAARRRRRSRWRTRR